MIAGIAWFVLYVVPTVKYLPVEVESRALQQRVKVASSSPEELFASGAAGTYQSLLAGYGAVSGLAALGIAFGSQKIKIKIKERMFEAVALYPVMVAAAFFAFDNYESEKDSLLPVLIQGSL